MNKAFLTLLLTTAYLTSFGQNLDSLSQQNNIHTDEKYGYSVIIPDWFNIKETGNPNLWGGTLEPVNGIENAILVNGFTKKDFKKIGKLIEDKVGQYKMGDKINSNQTFLLRKELGVVENIGVGYKVQILTGRQPYYSTYVFAKTKKGFLWIIFTATPDTYDINFEKFKDFLNSLKIE